MIFKRWVGDGKGSDNVFQLEGFYLINHRRNILKKIRLMSFAWTSRTV